MEDDSVRAQLLNRPAGEPRKDRFTSLIDVADVFRRLITDELHDGRLSAARCRAIVRYARPFGLSSRQVARLIDECRDVALKGTDPTARRTAQRLVDLQPGSVSEVLKYAVIGVGLILLELLCLCAIR